jgi:hypothetical protein
MWSLIWSAACCWHRAHSVLACVCPVGSRSPVLLYPVFFLLPVFLVVGAVFLCKPAEHVAISCYLALISARPLVLVQTQCHCSLGFRLLRVSGCSPVIGDFVAGPVPFLLAFIPTLLLVCDSSPGLDQGACFLGFRSQR